MAPVSKWATTVRRQSAARPAGSTPSTVRTTASGSRTAATTDLPLPPPRRSAAARFSPSPPDSSTQLCGAKRSASSTQAASVARATMFMPPASPVEKEKVTITSRPVTRGSTRRSLPWRVVRSAAARSSGSSAGMARAKATAWPRSPKLNTGAPRFSSCSTYASAPPARVTATIPRS